MAGKNLKSMSVNDIYISKLETEVIRQKQKIDNLTTELNNWRNAAEKYSYAFYKDLIPMSISRINDGIMIEINNALTETLGFCREEVIDKSVFDLQVWVEPRERLELVKETAEKGYVRDKDFLLRKKNGEIIQGHITSSLINIDDNRCMIIALQDVTTNARLRKALQLANEMFSKAFYDNLTMMAITRLEDGVYIDVNSVFADKFGWTREEIIGKSSVELGIWEANERKDMYEQLCVNGCINDWERSFKRRDGEIIYALLTINVLEIYGEKCLIVSARDFTRRKKVEEALKQSKKLLLQIVNSIPLSIVAISVKDKRIIEVNDTFLVQHNLVRENITGKNKIYLHDWLERMEVDDYFDLVIAQGFIQNREVSYQLFNGESRISLMSGVLISWEGEECVLVISNDITELRNYQKEMARLDNLKLIGQMSAGMAHEIRNPMTSIRGYLELFKMRDRYKDDMEALELMIEEIDRLNELITVFMSLSLNKEIDLKPQNLKTTIMNFMPLILVDAYQQNVSVQAELQDTEQVMIDEAQIRQLIFNLAHNGLDAMPRGGILTVRTYQDHNGVNLVIQDQGNGISSEILDQIGTPFFSTKDNGTGLGLAVCYSIVENHNAKINFITSSEGTAITVAFPIAANGEGCL